MEFEPDVYVPIKTFSCVTIISCGLGFSEPTAWLIIISPRERKRKSEHGDGERRPVLGYC